MNYKTGKDLLDEAISRITQITAEEAREMRDRGEDILFLDVRELNEWNLGRIPGAVHINRGNLESKVESLIERDKRIVVYCGRGNRSAMAADTLQQMGYSNGASISDGWGGWVAIDGDVED